MHPDEIHMDGVERRFVGPHGAVLLRIDHNLVRSVVAVRKGRDSEPLVVAPVTLRRVA